MKFFFPVGNARTLKNPFEDSGSHVEKRTFSYVEIQNIPKEFRNFIQQDFFDPHMKEKAMSILQEHPQEFHLFITPILIHADIARFDNRKNKILVALDEKIRHRGLFLEPRH